MTEVDMGEIPSGLWIKDLGVAPKAVVVLAHGLNLKPEKMDGWAEALHEHGAAVLRIGLFGHRGTGTPMGEASAQMWQEEFKTEAEEARALAQKYKVPLYFLGFSLGAVVGLDWQAAQGPQKGFDKMVLIAPALVLPWYSRQAIRFFSMFGRSFMLPSRSPVDYRANKGTSIAAYEALFDIKALLEKTAYTNTNLDTLVFIDKDDELISSEGIKQVMKKYHLNKWELNLVDNGFAYRNHGFRHLMVDQDSMGPDLWRDLTTRIHEHFEL